MWTDLASQNIEVTLNRKTNMEAVIKIIEENIPEVKLIHQMFLILVSEKISQKLFAVVIKKVQNVAAF